MAENENDQKGRTIGCVGRVVDVGRNGGIKDEVMTAEPEIDLQGRIERVNRRPRNQRRRPDVPRCSVQQPHQLT